MSEKQSPFPYAVEVPGIGVCTVLEPEGVPGYRVQMPNGEVWAMVAPSGEPSPENAANDIAHQPEPEPAPVIITPLTLLSRLTDPEKVGIFTSEDVGVVLFRNMAIAAREIRSDDERTADGFAYLVSLGLLAANRPAQLLAP